MNHRRLHRATPGALPRKEQRNEQRTEQQPRPAPGSFKRQGYRHFHPVTSTLVILSGGTVAFFIVFYLVHQICRYLQL